MSHFGENAPKPEDGQGQLLWTPLSKPGIQMAIQEDQNDQLCDMPWSILALSESPSVRGKKSNLPNLA